MNSEEARTKAADGVNVSVRYVSMNRTSQVGAADHFVSVRVVPDGRDGTTVFARTLHPGEVDLDEPVVFSPALGERLVFRKECRIRIRDVDRLVKSDETGYASVTNTMWTWLHLSGKATPQQVRFALATARRLDGTHLSLATLISALRELHTLSVPIEVPRLLVSMREYLVEAIGVLCGEWSPLDEAAFGPAPRAPEVG